MKTKGQVPAANLAPPLKLSHQVLSRMGFLGIREVANYNDERPFRPKRAEIAMNVVHTSSRGARLQQPDPELITLIEHEEPKVKYFPVAPTTQFSESRVGFMNNRSYEHSVLFELDAKLRNDFPGRQLFTRTTHVSINGSIRTRDMILMDAVDVAQRGEEKGSHTFGTVWVDTSKPLPLSHYPFKDYGGELTGLRHQVDNDGRDEDVFPAMIVYDPEHMEREGYTTHITGSPDAAVLGVYLLDAPLRS